METALENGGTVVIVTRTDHTPNDARGGDGGLPVGTFRVESFVGPQPPSVLHGELDTGSSCRPYVVPGAIAALSAGRDEQGTWSIGGCGDGYPIGPALQLAQGDPEPGGGGPAVAYAAGDFGGARLVALDELGQTLAWGIGAGAARHVTLCPGGRTVVALGGPDGGGVELSAHDAADLRVRRTVPLQSRALAERTPAPVLAVHCRDATGEQVDVLLRSWDGTNGRILHVDGTTVARESLGRVAAAAAVPDGFVVALGDGAAKLVHIGADGRRELARLDRVSADSHLAVSPDSKTIAVQANGALLTLDSATGKQLGRHASPTSLTGLAWAGSDRLLLRREMAYRQTPVPLYAFDRRLKPVGEWGPVMGEWGGAVGAVGDAAVIHGRGSRLTVIRGSDTPLVADSLRLAAADHLVGVPGRNFAAGKPTLEPHEAEPGTVTVADKPESSTFLDSSVVVGVLGGTTGVALLGGAVGLARRRRS